MVVTWSSSPDPLQEGGPSFLPPRHPTLACETLLEWRRPTPQQSLTKMWSVVMARRETGRQWRLVPPQPHACEWSSAGRNRDTETQWSSVKALFCGGWRVSCGAWGGGGGGLMFPPLTCLDGNSGQWTASEVLRGPRGNQLSTLWYSSLKGHGGRTAEETHFLAHRSTRWLTALGCSTCSHSQQPTGKAEGSFDGRKRQRKTLCCNLKFDEGKTGNKVQEVEKRLS